VEADELGKLKLVKTLPLFTETRQGDDVIVHINASMLNSYLVDLTDYLRRCRFHSKCGLFNGGAHTCLDDGEARVYCGEAKRRG
jgi:hypothetical protein